ncbi:hypothetical protein Taro_000436 [Colocasia esculenta]|uniref:Uncharacterized protein n=1 Tax=Colocasia esculenta TaxID=4460 RepID=A0A843TCW3_COLES|nr:hypothetical protein [Colocasia esculenta]
MKALVLAPYVWPVYGPSVTVVDHIPRIVHGTSDPVQARPIDTPTGNYKRGQGSHIRRRTSASSRPSARQQQRDQAQGLLPNDELENAARNPNYGDTWVREHVGRYYPATQIDIISLDRGYVRGYLCSKLPVRVVMI